MITMIVAISKNGCIGKDGRMPWNLPNEMKHFRKMTMNKKVVVGRKTFEGFKKPLENRYHFVVTRQDIEYNYSSVEVVHDVRKLIAEYKNADEELMIIGGKEIYSIFMEHADKLIVSVIHQEFDGDTYFPEIDENNFKITNINQNDEFDVVTWIRKEN